VHFTKVGEQTREMLGDLIALGELAQLPVDALRSLSQ
jgi:hypothetical protein